MIKKKSKFYCHFVVLNLPPWYDLNMITATYEELLDENKLLKERDQLREAQTNLLTMQVKHLTEQIEWFKR